MLTFELTDLIGAVKERFVTHMGGEVNLIHCDSATAKLTLPVTDKKVKAIKPLSTMIRVFLDDLSEPIFWGVTLTPIWRSTGQETGTVEINAHDQSIWWKRNYHRYGDIVVDKGYPVSGQGLRDLHESAEPLPSQVNRGIPGPGIDWGVNSAAGYHWNGADYVDGYGPRSTKLGAPKVNDGLWTIATRGQNVYDSIQALQQVDGGPEWRLRPTITLPAGYYAKLDTSRRFGQDRAATVVFHRGTGRKNNCESFEYTPDGNAVRNYWVEVYPGGEENRADSNKKGLAHSESSWLKYGIYQGWESSGNQDPNAVLVAKAKEYVRYYKEPPEYFTVTPNSLAPAYKHKYDLGDTVRGTCKEGNMLVEVDGRVMSVTLTQPPQQQMTTAITCVPDIPGTDPSGDPGG